MKFSITVEKKLQKKLSPEQLREQLKFIGNSAKRSASANWSVSIPGKLIREQEIVEEGLRKIQYTAVINVSKDRYKDADAVRRRFDKTKIVMAKAANRQGWTFLGDEALVPAGTEYVVVNGAGEAVGDPAPRINTVTGVLPQAQSRYLTGEEDLPPLTDEILKKYFYRIYDRDAHIRIVYDNIRLAVKTRFKTRHHILLKGPPACAKTELFLAFIEWLGDDFIEAIDGGTMTKAGLEHLLLKKAQDGTLKPILLLEEIEKCHPENVSCLIQVMDARGKIQRVNANTVRDGNGSAACPIIVWGTCNDDDELKKAHKGAIWSRFSSKMDCQRPDRDLMRLILTREIAEIDGKESWVEPVVNFCFDELAKIPRFKDDFDDPRVARAMLVGGDRILDGSYFADFRKTNKISK